MGTKWGIEGAQEPGSEYNITSCFLKPGKKYYCCIGFEVFRWVLSEGQKTIGDCPVSLMM